MFWPCASTEGMSRGRKGTGPNHHTTPVNMESNVGGIAEARSIQNTNAQKVSPKIYPIMLLT